MEIQTVSLVGLGALGAMFGAQMQKNLPAGSLRVIADEARIRRYKKEGVNINGTLCHFNYTPPGADVSPADLVVFAVKFGALPEAIRAADSQVGKHTVVLSVLNGISSEAMLAEAYGPEKVLYCVAQGMDVRKSGNRVVYDHMGLLSFGERTGPPSARVQAVARLLARAGIAWETPEDMQKKMWSKFMLNCGVNQAAMVYNTTYGGLQQPGTPREAMLAAMREVLPLAKAEGVALGEEDIAYWMGVLNSLGPEGFPSMRQDADAKRPSEVELFSGTVRRLGQKHGLPTPVNDKFYETILAREAQY